MLLDNIYNLIDNSELHLKYIISNKLFKKIYNVDYDIYNNYDYLINIKKQTCNYCHIYNGNNNIILKCNNITVLNCKNTTIINSNNILVIKCDDMFINYKQNRIYYRDKKIKIKKNYKYSTDPVILIQRWYRYYSNVTSVVIKPNLSVNN